MKEDIIESTDKQDKGEISKDDNDKDDNGCSVDSRRPDHTPKINTDCTENPSSSLLPSLPKSKTKQKRRSKIVSFTEEVLSRDHSGDGTNVVVKEEQGVFLGPFLGRVTMSSASNDDNHNNDNDNDNDNTPDAVSTSTWLSPSSPLALSPECGSEHGGNGGGSEGCAERVTFDNLVVRMGLLKCGHRYRLVIPVPGSSDDSESKSKSKSESKSKSKNRRRKLAARIIEQSIDGDLKGEIETERQDGCTAPRQYCLKITLSASRRGPYRGRFAMELLSFDATTTTTTTTTATTRKAETETETSPTKKCIMSIQVDATIMGKDMGTPKLRNGVVCLGKMVGYDSDDDTEWQGFD
eukprot:jgi/Psemu1/188939/e_gw1.82.87.1